MALTKFKLIHSYLSNRKQSVKTNGRYSLWSEMLEDFDIVNYADNTAPCCAGKSAEFIFRTIINNFL